MNIKNLLIDFYNEKLRKLCDFELNINDFFDIYKKNDYLQKTFIKIDHEIASVVEEIEWHLGDQILMEKIRNKLLFLTFKPILKNIDIQKNTHVFFLGYRFEIKTIRYYLFDFFDSFFQSNKLKDSHEIWKKIFSNYKNEIEIIFTNHMYEKEINDLNSNSKFMNLKIWNNINKQNIPNIFKVTYLKLIDKSYLKNIDKIDEFFENENQKLKNADKNLNLSYDLKDLWNKGLEQVKNFFKLENSASQFEKNIIEYYFDEQYNYQNYYHFLLIIIGYFTYKKSNKELNLIFKQYVSYLELNDNFDEKELIQSINKKDKNLMDLLMSSFDFNDLETKKLIINNYFLEEFKEKRKEKAINFMNQTFYNRIIEFLNEYYENNYELEISKDNINKNIDKIVKWQSLFCQMEDNWEIIKDKKIDIDKLIYKYIYILEMNLSSSSKNRIKSESSEFCLDNGIEIIKDSYDGKKIILLAKEEMSQYNEFIDFSKIDPIVFVDNNLLCRRERIRFSSLERKGDKLYEMIIYYLIIEGKIKKECELYFSASFQNILCQSLNINKIIQTNNLYFGSKDGYENADYFEALLNDIYLNSSFDNVANFIHKLFKDNCKGYLTDDSFTKEYRVFDNLKNLIYTPLIDNDIPNDEVLDIMTKINDAYINYLFIEKYNLPDRFYQLSSFKNIWYCKLIEKQSINHQLYCLLKNDFNKYKETAMSILVKNLSKVFLRYDNHNKK